MPASLCAVMLFATMPASGTANDNEIKLNDTWSYISTGNHGEDKYIESLFIFLHKKFKSVFDTDVIDGITCTIYIDENEAGPFIHFVSNKEIKIRLRLANAHFWCQLVFQLAHEMTHYIFCQTYDFMKFDGSKWNEEIVSDAMALYMLKQLADNWDDFVLSKYDQYRDTPYSLAIYMYIDNELRKAIENTLKSSQEAITIQQFAEFNKNAGTNRENHRAEVNYLYSLLITLEKEQIKPIILEMYQYLVDDTYIDYETWIRNAKYPSVIKKLSKIQPQIQK
jgi:hypothetical protein